MSPSVAGISTYDGTTRIHLNLDTVMTAAAANCIVQKLHPVRSTVLVQKHQLVSILAVVQSRTRVVDIHILDNDARHAGAATLILVEQHAVFSLFATLEAINRDVRP